jgi:hypothetical protein
MPFHAILTLAFVALVIPFDRSEGLQGQNIAVFFLCSKGVTAWVMGRQHRKNLPHRH